MGKRVKKVTVRIRKRIRRKPIVFDEIELDLSVSCLQNIYAETYNPYVISIIFLYIINVELDIFILLVYSRKNYINLFTLHF